MPHFPARIIKDKDTLKNWIGRYKNEAGVENALLKSYKEIIHSDIPTIEKYGGGSARCMLTELF